MSDVSSSSKTNQPLFLYFENAKVGYIDATGKIIIPARFDMAGLFKNGIAPASQEGSWGYIDRTGTFIIPPQWKSAGHFNDGVACVKLRDEELYEVEIIDGVKKKRIFRKPIYTLINTQGNPVNGVEFEPCFHGSLNWLPPEPRDGRICVTDTHGDYYLGLTGHPALGPFVKAYPFQDGVAVVRSTAAWSVIDSKGGFIIDAVDQKYLPWLFSEGFSVAEKFSPDGYPSEKKGYMNKSGKIVIPFVFKLAFPFYQGMAIVKDEKDQYLVINKSGATVAVPPPGMSFDGIFASEGMVVVSKPSFMGDGYGYMDVKTGVVVIPPVFEEAFPFRNGLAWVSMTQPPQSGYIDKKGHFVWRAQNPGKLEYQIRGEYRRLINEMNELL